MNPVYRSNLFMLIIVIGQVIGSVFLSMPLQKLFSYNQFLVVTQILFLLIPVLVYLLVTGLPIKSTLKLNRISLRDIIIIILIAVVSQPVGSFLSALSGLFFENIVNEVLQKMGAIPYITQLGIIAVTPAICEEVTMRGIILSGYERVSRAKAAIATGLLFAILHMNPQQFLYAFVLGILFAYLVRITNSIFSTMICHFIFNGLQVTMAYIIARVNPEALRESSSIASFSIYEKLMTLLPLFLLAIVCTCIVISLVKKLDRRNSLFHKQYSTDLDREKEHFNVEEDMPHLPRRRNYYNIEERIINVPLIAVIIIYVAIMAVTELLR